jgi:hypothetical protein
MQHYTIQEGIEFLNMWMRFMFQNAKYIPHSKNKQNGVVAIGITTHVHRKTLHVSLYSALFITRLQNGFKSSQNQPNTNVKLPSNKNITIKVWVF